MVTIVVTGSAARDVPAEIAEVGLRATGTGPDRTALVAAVTQEQQRLAREAADLVTAGAATTWSAAGLTTAMHWAPHPAPDSPDRQRVFVVSADVAVTFQDSTALQTWLPTVAEREHVEVIGVSWQLNETTREAVLETVREAAVGDAIARAKTYAAAARLGAPRLRSLYEDGLRPGGSGGPVPMFAARAMADHGGGGAGLDLRPQDISVEVVISADFEAS